MPDSEQTYAVVAGIDRILDLARTALDVTGDGTVLIARSEGQMEMYATPHVLEVPDMHDA
ncbi:MAG: hypothetical protein ABJN26_12735 [Stappiaceae bacterium]